MAVTIDGTTGITTPGLTNTGTDTLVDLTTTGNTVIGNATTDTLVVGVNGIVKDTFGNVGIGTTTPAAKLDVGLTGAQTVPAARFYSNYATIQSLAGFSIYNNVSGGFVDTALVYGNIPQSYLTFGHHNGTSYSERMRIDSSGNLIVKGTNIAPTSPSRLHVIQTGTSYTSGLTISPSGDGNDGLSLYQNATNNPTAIIENVWDRPGAPVYSDILINPSGGNVGIGTTSPSGRLHVTAAAGSQTVAYFGNQTAGARTDIQIFSASNSDGYIWFARSSASENGGIRYNHSSDFMAFQTNAAERMRIDSAGRVGINVSPSTATTAQLQVTGGTVNATTLLTAYSQATVAIVPKSTSGYSLAIASGTSDLPQLQVSANGTAAGDLLIQPYGGFTYINTLRLRGSDTYQIYESASTTNLQFGTNGAAAFVFSAVGVGERMRIDSSGNLQIASTGTLANLFLGMNSIPGSMGNAYLYANTGVVVTNNGAANPYYQWYNTQGATDKKTWRMGTQSGGNLIFETVNDAYSSSTARMNIDASGNVSIGTTNNNVFDQISGARPLLVQKSDTSTTIAGSTASITISNGDTTTNNTAQINFAAITGASTNQYSAATISAVFGARTNGQYPTGQLVFSTSTSLNAAPTEKMRIDSSGNVGIGTASPGTQFNVYKSTATTVNIRPQNSLAYADFGPQADGSVYGPYASPAASTQLVVGTSNSNPFTFYTNGTERMRIDSSGNVGIGTSSPSKKVEVYATSNTLQIESIVRNDQAGTGVAAIGFNVSSSAAAETTSTKAGIGLVRSAGYGVGSLVFYNNGTSSAGDFTTADERMRIDSSGNLLVGNTGLSSGKFQLYNSTGTGVYSQQIFAEYASGTGLFIEFLRRNGATNNAVGAISASTTTTTYATSSDYRLKKDAIPITNALAKVSALKPVTYKWKLDDSNGEGFIAHELAEVCPHAVVGEKDAVDADGNPQYQGIDTSFLVATLTAALQEAHGLIKDLQVRVNALEAK